MKLRLFTSLLLTGWAFMSFAQTKPMELKGMIIVNGADTIPYKLIVTETKGEINGYSVTYDEPYETKTKITGLLDRSSHTLAFKESDIVYSRGYHNGPSMCLINAVLDELQDRNGNMLKGPVTSAESDNTACGNGKVIFNDPAQVADLFSYHEKFDTVISMKGRVREIAPVIHTSKAIDTIPLVTDKITTGEEKSYEWHTDTVIIDVWDGGNVDGDRITLKCNDKTYLSSYFLIKEKKRLRIPLSNGVNVITIVADNEGSDPPNTASMLFTDGNVKYSLLAYNKKGQEAIIKIRRVKSR